MKKTIETLLGKLSQAPDGILKGGYASIKGGMSIQAFGTNADGCTNSGTCTGNNTGVCSNTGDCTGTTNSGPGCTNKYSCNIK